MKMMVLVACGAMLLGGVAQGAVDAKDKALLERLNSPEWKVREAASTELIGQKWDLARLQGMYQAAPSLEAKERLLAGARHQYFSKLISGRSSEGDTGALGIYTPKPEMHLQPAGSLAPVRALYIVSPMCGMPGAIALRPGDRVVKVGTTDLTQLPADAELYGALVMQVQLTKVGDKMPMTVERDGQRMEVTVTMGSMIGMSAVEQTGGFGQRPDAGELWRQEKEKITGAGG